MDYAAIKLAIEQYSGLEKDALHVHAALLLYLIAMLIFRQTRRSRIPWLFVLFIELANEALDLRRHYLAHGSLAWDESLKDMWNTMLWPTVLLFIGRYTTLFQRKTRQEEAETQQPAG